MTNETESLILEILKRVQSDMATVKEDLHLMRLELTAIRHDLAGLRTHQDVQSAQIATLRERVDRIEARLEISE